MAVVARCRGCGTEVDLTQPGVWACPRSEDRHSDIDHVLVLPDDLSGSSELDTESQQPFVRYRRRLASYRAATERGWSDQQFVDMVRSLDRSIIDVWGSGFTVTPLTHEAALASAVGVDELWVKDETRNVSGSHKARHLFGLALWLAVRGESDGRLAISSCGNAAMAAAVVARAGERQLDVFVPEWADSMIVASLESLGANVTRCVRGAGELGDPCMARFREAVARGAVPFGCQGPDNGLTIDGGRTIGWELAEQAPELGSVFVQVGGGALATSLADGLRSAGSSTRVVAVQADGCAPFDRAWQRIQASSLDESVRHRSTAMWPWESAPHSVATGILDDETYDWAGLADGLARSGGGSIVAEEHDIVRAHELAHAHTNIDVDATGSAGLAGLIANLRDGGSAVSAGPSAVLFTGVTRRAH